MKVTLLLADAAQVCDGKLYVLGGGWSLTGPGPTPSAVVVKVDVPWDRANRRHVFKLELFDADGNAVAPDPGLPGETVAVGGEFEVGRPPGTTPGSTIDVPMAFPIAPLPLPPGQRYEWRFTIDDHHDEEWTLPFATRSVE